MTRKWLFGLLVGLIIGLLAAELVRTRRKMAVKDLVIEGLEEAVYNRPRALELEGVGNGRS